MNTAAASTAVNGGIHGGVRVDRRLRPHNNQQPLNCPRCDSINTKFCYYNNYNLSQPRHFCKNCRRYWTHGGVLRNVPVGGGCRKSNRRKRRRAPTQHPPSSSESSTAAAAAVATTTTSVNDGVLQLRYPDNEYNPRLFTGGFVSLMNNNTDDHTTSFGEIFEPIATATATTKIDELMENRGGYGGLASTVDNWKDNSTAAANVDQSLFEFGSGIYDDRVYWNQSMNVVEDHINWGRNCYDFPLFLP